MAFSHDLIHSAARVYSEALLELASERGIVDEVEGQLKDLMSLWKSQPAFSGLMTSAAIDDDARRTSLRRIFAGRVHDLVLNLMLVMNDKGRTMMLPAVCEAFFRMLDTQRGRQRVYVTTAVALSDEMRTKLSQEVRRIARMQPVFEERVDPAVVGGMVVQIGDQVIDTSIRLRLRQVRSTVRQRMERHLHDAGQRFMKETA